MAPENLRDALLIVQYGGEIRKRVAEQFWSKLERELKQNQPVESSLTGWEHTPADKPTDEFALNALLKPVGEDSQGLKYGVATAPKYFGVGLMWLHSTADFEALCRRRPVKILQDHLRKKCRGDVEPDPNCDWLWWENWERSPYDDPWYWFANDKFDDTWFKDKSQKFWEFVTQTHALVADANVSLKQVKR